MLKSEIMDRMFEIQKEYNNDVESFQKDEEFIRLNSLLGGTRINKIHLQKIIEE